MAKKRSPKNETASKDTTDQPPSVQDRIQVLLNELTDAELNILIYEEAYDEGYDAYWEGVDETDNPHDEEKDADARLSWEQGWRKAREHDYDGDD